MALATCVGVGLGIGTGCGRTVAGPFASGSDDATTLGANAQTTGASSDGSAPSPLGQTGTSSGSVGSVVGTTGQLLPDPGGPNDVGTQGGTGGDDGVEPNPDDADVPYQLTPGGADLYAVSGAAGRVFAVGEAGTIANWSSESFARGLDGIDWIQVPVEANLVGVWAAPSGVVWAVSDDGQIVRGNVEGWQPEVATDTQLAAIWGAAEDAIWAVGVDVIWHYDGVLWQLSESLPEAALTHVYGTSARDVLVAGAAVWHFDGNTWSPLEPHPGRINRWLDIFPASDSRLWVTGTWSNYVSNGAGPMVLAVDQGQPSELSENQVIHGSRLADPVDSGWSLNDGRLFAALYDSEVVSRESAVALSPDNEWLPLLELPGSVRDLWADGEWLWGVGDDQLIVRLSADTGRY